MVERYCTREQSFQGRILGDFACPREFAMNNQWLDQQGVPSIENQWINIRYPNGPAKDRARVP
jgi:hypothetical protein